MKKTLNIGLSLLLALSAAGCSTSTNTASSVTSATQETASVNEELTERLDAVAHRNDGKSLLGLAVEVIKEDEVAFKYATGVRHTDSENTDNDLPFTTDTKVRIASVSKTFTAVGIMQLVEEGKIDLDEDVSEYLGFDLKNPAYPDTAITTRMLLSHTSSIDDGEVYTAGPQYTLKDFFTKKGEFYEEGAHFMEHEPGTYFTYSNLGFGVLGTIVEAVSGERFDEYMTAHILNPMGMTASFNVTAMDDEAFDNIATVYRKNWDEEGNALEDSPWVAQIDDYSEGKPAENTVRISDPYDSEKVEWGTMENYVIGSNATCMAPQGGLRISADELAEWALMFTNDGKASNGTEILEPETVEEMTTAQWTWNGAEDETSNGDPMYGLMQSWGLGLQLVTNGLNGDYGDTFLDGKKVENLVGHYGDAYGMFSIFMIDRDNDCGFIYMINGAECDLEAEPAYGEYSENWLWEEEMATAIYDTVLSDYAK